MEVFFDGLFVKSFFFRIQQFGIMVKIYMILSRLHITTEIAFENKSIHFSR